MKEPRTYAELAIMLRDNPQARQIMSQYQAEYRLNVKAGGELAAFKGVLSTLDEYHAALPPEVTSQISCKKGCSFCCNIPVTATPIEAKVIAEYCKRNNIKIPRAYLEEQLKVSPEELPLSPVRKCTFLKDNECSIYDARPIACRNHFVVSDPKHCDTQEHWRDEIAMPSFIDREILVFAIIMDMDNDRLQKHLLPYSK